MTAEQGPQERHGASEPWGGWQVDDLAARGLTRAAFEARAAAPAQVDDQLTTADIVEGEVWAWLNRHDAPWSPSDAKVGDLARAVAAALGARQPPPRDRRH